MSLILHLSDFHLGKNFKLEKSKIDALAKWLVSENILIKYLVFTGDIVDARAISKKCIIDMIKLHPEEYGNVEICNIDNNIDGIVETIKSNGQEHIDEYNHFLMQNYSENLNKAKEIFISFIQEIGVPFDRIIMCCGNHDRIRKLSNDEDMFSCSGNNINESDYFCDFEPYYNFCSSINSKLSHNTNIYKYEDLDFVVANTNWRVPQNGESNNMCIHCNKVADLLTQIRETPDYDRNKTIFIAHKPFDDICETAKFPYADGQLVTLYELIERTALMFLYGDKHSYGVKMKNSLKEFMCGVPISYDNVRYNLIDYDPNCGVKSCKYIFNGNGGWSMVPVTDCSDKVYNMSREYLKPFAVSILSKNDYTKVPSEWEQAISLMRESLSNGNLELASQMFSACGSINKEKEKISFDKNKIFEQFYSFVESGTTHRPVSIKGIPGTGKSTLLSIQYLYMFFKFYNGTSKYIPFYFNIDKIISTNEVFEKEPVQIEETINVCYDKLNEYIDRCLSVGDEYKLPICVFIDGLQKRNMLLYSSKTLESRVYEMLETKFKNHNDKYVMCLDTHQTKLFEKTFNQMNRFDYVLFLNPVNILSYKNKTENSNILISSFLKLRNHDENKIDDFITKIKKLHKTYVDLNLLYRNYSLINKTEMDYGAWDLMKRYVSDLSEFVEDLFGASNLEQIREAAYLVFHRGKTFEEIIDKSSLNTLSYKDFIVLRDHQEVCEYLRASYFVDELKKYSRVDKEIPADSMINDFITRDLAIMIRLILENETETQRLLKAFVDKHHSELSGFLYSNIVYFAGHIKNGNSYELVNMITGIKNQENSTFFEFCHERSSVLAKVFSTNNQELADEFVCKLMDNDTFRRFNRIYQLHYYQDILDYLGERQSEWDINKTYGTGFDFYNCFLVLVSKLDLNLCMQEPYPLIVIDLFTICDFIYSRLQNVDSDRSLFYSACYNKKGDSICKSILIKVSSIITAYMSNTEMKESHDEYVNNYFKFMKNKFEEIIVELEKNTDKNVITPYVSESYEFKEILKLQEMPRVMWNITSVGQVKIDDQPCYENSDENNSDSSNDEIVVSVPRETIMQHIMETVYIAQIFLPEYIPMQGYNKSTIISLLLLSELGKSKSGDYTLDYTNAKSRYIPNEQTSLAKFLMLGTVDGYANNKMFFNSLIINDGAINELDCNAVICKEIKSIQIEYKYYSLYEALDFDKERRKQFEENFVEPTTPICKEIRRKLVRSNPEFKKYFLKQ